MMTASALPPGTRLGSVHLRVAGLDRALAFYRDLLGLRARTVAEREALLYAGAGEEPVLRLTADPDAPRRAPGTTGLYHLALLVPDRQALAEVLVRLARARYPLQGMSDHAVSEALYLADPEGNGIEIYADRDPAEWPRSDGQLAMTTLPLDVDGLLEAARAPEGAGLPDGTRIGHVHLQLHDLAAAERFYRGLVGFDVTVRGYPGALFLSAGGYHHHLGLNTWAGSGAPRPAEGALGLVEYEVVVPQAEALHALEARLVEGGLDVDRRGGSLGARDPAGNRVVFRAGAPG